MGDFNTNPSNVLFADKSAHPGVVVPPGWTSQEVVRVVDVQAIKDGLLDVRRQTGGWVTPTDTSFAGGADPTGAVDARAAIQAALDTGRNVDFGGGIYKITAALQVKTSRQQLVGRNATINAIGAATSVFVIGGADEAHFVKTDDVLIDGFTFTGQADGVTAGPPAAITVTPPVTNPYVEGGGCSRITIRNVRESGFAIGVIATAADRLLVQDSEFGGNVYYPSLSAAGYGVLLQTCFKPKVVHNTFTATANDRHAVYVSANGNRTFDDLNVCSEVVLQGNTIDWSALNGVGSTKFEAAIVLRAPHGAVVSDNTIRGGYGGISYDGWNGNGSDIVIKGNSLTGQIGSVSGERAAIQFSRTSGSYIAEKITIIGNTVDVNEAHAYALVLLAVKDVNVSGNVFRTQGVAVVSWQGSATSVHVAGNTLHAMTAGTRIIYSAGASNDEIQMGPNKELHTGGTANYAVWITVPTNLRWGYARSASVRANSTGSPVVVSDPDIIVASVATDTNGIAITFADGVNLAPENIALTAQGSSIANLYRRAVSGQVLTVGVLTVSGSPGVLAPLPAASNSYDLVVTVLR